MHSLDDIDEIRKIDKGNILASIVLLPQQVEQAWREVNNLEIPQNFKEAKNIVLSGMGGSALGGRIIDSLILERLRAPFEVFTGFKLPRYANSDTLFIASSYSGNTEETLSSAKDAIAKGVKMFGIGTGGKLEEFFKSEKKPFYQVLPYANPSNQPRMGLGYAVTSILALLAKLKFIDIAEGEITSTIRIMGEFMTEFGVDNPSHQNLAKATAAKIKGKIPVIIASEHLLGSAHAFKNQLNENAKTFSVLFDIPEMNHHLLEGLTHPAEAKERLMFLFIESQLYPKEIGLRYPITREVVEKNEVKTASFRLRSEGKLEQIFELLLFGSFVSLYLALLYGTDPYPIPWVDYFKEKLSKN